MRASRLPTVHPDTVCSVASDFRFRTDLENLATMLRELHNENPVVAGFIREWLKERKVKGEQEVLSVAFCGIIVYRLLASQEKADGLDKQLKRKLC